MKITIQINNKPNGGVTAKLEIDPPLPTDGRALTLGQLFTVKVMRRMPEVLRQSLFDCNDKRGG